MTNPYRHEDIAWISEARDIADWMPWDVLITMLNAYLECITRPVEDGSGQIFKFKGDGFIATFDLDELD